MAPLLRSGLAVVLVLGLLPAPASAQASRFEHELVRTESEIRAFASRLMLEHRQIQGVRRILAWETPRPDFSQGFVQALSPKALDGILRLLVRGQRQAFLKQLGPRLEDLRTLAQMRRSAKSKGGAPSMFAGARGGASSALAGDKLAAALAALGGKKGKKRGGGKRGGRRRR